MYGARIVIALSTVVTAACLVICSYIPNYILFIVVYATLEGLGCSGIVFPCMYPSWYFFPKRKGTVTGIIMVAYGAGCAIQGIAFTYLMNPDNELPTLDVYSQKEHEKLFDYRIARNYPMTFRVFAAAFLVIGLLGSLLITEPKMTYEERKTISEGGSQSGGADYGHTTECPSLKVAVKTWAFCCLLLVGAFGYTYDYYLLVQYKTYAASYIHDDHLLSIIGSIGQIGNIFGRLILSILVDFVDNRILLFTNLLINSVMSYTLKYAVENEIMYTAWICISLFAFGFCLSPTAVICGKIFGSKYSSHRTGGTVFSFVMLGLLFGNLSTIAINSGIQQNYGFDAAFNFMSLTALCVSILALTMKVRYDWELAYSELYGEDK